MSELLKQINSLAVFGGLRQKEPLKSLCTFLRSTETPGTRLEDVIEAYSNFVREVYMIRTDADFSGALWDALKEDENVYFKIATRNMMAAQTGEEKIKLSRLMEVEVDRELDILTAIGNTSYIDLQNLFYYDGHIAQFKTTGIDLKKRYMAYLSVED
ncbi:hypothetical protein SAMN02910264_01038 [Ruminococcaceae bacterium YAD3003]|nr:hypothetical protein SAMN02910264_01038 [Ruminococcaceae bacterium YAD3003]